MMRPGESVHAPHLVDLEVANALRKLAGRREVTGDRARAALEDWGDARIVRHPHANLLDRIWQLQAGVNAYDAAYLALAEALVAPLVTCDGRLARSSGHRARIRLIA